MSWAVSLAMSVLKGRLAIALDSSTPHNVTVARQASTVARLDSQRNQEFAMQVSEICHILTI